jgi:hypothetical protein
VLLWPDVLLLTGKTKSGGILSILRTGTSDCQTEYYFSGQVFTEILEQHPLGRIWFWTLPKLAKNNGCAFILARVASSRAPFAQWLLDRKHHRSIHLPVLVELNVDVTDMERVLRSDSLRSDLRVIKKYGHHFSISRNMEEIKTFIREYHDPYVKVAHGFDMIEMDFQRVLATCLTDEMPAPWELLKVELAGEWVAGMLLVNGKDRAALMELGVKNADRSLVKRGALSAAYWLSVEYLRSQGHKRVSFMHTRPFLNNGVLRYKLKYGQSMRIARPEDGFLLSFDQENPATREVLFQQPLLAFQKNGLCAVLFTNGSDESSDNTLMTQHWSSIGGINAVEKRLLVKSSG